MQLSRNDVIAIFDAIRRSVTAGKDLLTSLDADLGDGDLGLTMVNGFNTVCQFLDSADAPAELAQLLMQAGFAMAEAVPSTMGTLVSTGIIRAGKAAHGRDGLDAAAGLEMFKAAVEGIAVRGKAKRGEKTLLDALYPALEAWEATLVAGGDIAACVDAAAQAADLAATSTASLRSVHGKAAVFGDQSLGKPDPGASAAAMIMRGARDWFSDKVTG
jgi:dihydroxyacetone kinase-like protein